MDISPKKSLKTASEPVDDWLHNEGYFRKHAPRHPTCLFRAISEQIYSTQHYHIRVRRECVDFMRQNSHLFEQSISIPFENYLEQMSCFTEWGGIKEIEAMSQLYKKRIVIFDGHRLVTKVAVENDFEDTIYLCHTPQKQYESVFARDYIATAAYCQSLVYQTLYKDVFKMANVDETVNKMLHDRTVNFRHEKFFLKGNLERRNQLTTELLNKVDKEPENSEEGKSVVVRNAAPFPYRVAKALDPNIYRNTDFDIWHEIRREARNARWTRWNAAELQIGGKCFVQVDHKTFETRMDETNNNVQVNDDEDTNENTLKNSTVNISIDKREPTLLHGHIQEMSKDEGPVVVFIEELGEKRILPYAALKPIPPRRGKQNNNWGLATYRKTCTYETNHKWKKIWQSSARKSRDSNLTYNPKDQLDRNNNSNEETADDKTEDTENIESWDEETSGQIKSTGLKDYTMGTYNGFTVHNTIDVRPVTVLLDNTPPIPGQRTVTQTSEDANKNTSPTAMKSPSNDNPDISSPNVELSPPDSIIQPLQEVSIHSPGELIYVPHPGMPSIFPINANAICNSTDGTAYSFPFPCFTDEPPTPGSLLDRTIRAINFSAPISIDANGSDLPFSDTVTLRFFYNLGLEYFRANHVWGCGANGQPMTILPSRVSQGNLPPNISMDGNMQQTSVIGESEPSSFVNAPRQNYGPRRRNDQQLNATKTNNGQQCTIKPFNNRKNDTQDYSHGQKNYESTTKPIGDSQRSQASLNNDRTKDHPNVRKNGSLSRHKNKHIEGRNRNLHQPNFYQQGYPQTSPIYHLNTVSIEPPWNKGIQNDSTRQGNTPDLQLSIQSPQFDGNQPSYGTPTIYATMPCYPSEGEGFYAPEPGFYPVPYVAHPGIGDGSSSNAYSPPHMYTSGSENYAQPTISAVYSPYMHPQQAIYPTLSPQNDHENWYPVPSQTQYVQYPVLQPPQQAPPNVNGITGSP